MVTAKQLIAQHEGVQITTCDRPNEHCLVFTFTGKLTESATLQAVQTWSDYQKTSFERQLTHIWMCSGMTGFENAAKNAWMAQMKNERQNIKRILLVADNIVIRGAARLMSKFTDLPLEVYKSEEEIA